MMLLESLAIGISAWVATAVLFMPGHLLEWWYNILDGWHNALPTKYKWVVKPLGYCGFCFSGQMGFWFYVLGAHFPISSFAPEYRLADNLIFALQSIFFWALFNGADNLYKKYNA